MMSASPRISNHDDDNPIPLKQRRLGAPMGALTYAPAQAQEQEPFRNWAEKLYDKYLETKREEQKRPAISNEPQ
jgi:hypothetical protein